MSGGRQAHWEPRQVLGIDPYEHGFTCTAIVLPKKQRGHPQEPPRRCQQTFISNKCKNRACVLLNNLARLDIVRFGMSKAIERGLVRIATHTACPRLHKEPGRSQAEKIGANLKAVVEQYVADERALKQREEREPERVVVSESRAAEVPLPLCRQRARAPHVVDVEEVEDSEVVRARERAARRARNDQRLPQPRPRQPQERQDPPQDQPNRRRFGFYAPEVPLQPAQQYPVQAPAPQLPRANARREQAALAAAAAERRLAEHEAEIVALRAQSHDLREQAALAAAAASRLFTEEQADRLAVRAEREALVRDGFVMREWVPRPYPARQPEVIPGPVVENMYPEHLLYQARRPEVVLDPLVQNRLYEPRRYAYQPAPIYRPVPAAFIPPRPAQHIMIDDDDDEEFEELIQREQERREERIRVRAELDRRYPVAPVIPIPPARLPARQLGFAPVEQPQPRQRAVPAPAPAQPYVPRRKPIVDCWVCTENFVAGEDIIWCQGQCGQNVHRACFEEWCVHEPHGTRACGFCRRPWVESPPMP